VVNHMTRESYRSTSTPASRKREEDAARERTSLLSFRGPNASGRL
jgi:hypothetical protein